MILQISNEDLRANEALWTAEEIAQQPQTWRQTAELVEKSGVQAFVAPLVEQAQQGKLRIIFTGAGTSAFIGDVVAPILSEKLGCVIESIASTDLVSNPAQYLFADTPTLLISFARSGNSPESLGAVERVNDIVKQPYHLAITNNARGALLTKFHDIFTAFPLALPDVTHDRGFAMTSSASNMMLAALLSLAPQAFDKQWLEQLIRAGQSVLDNDAQTIKTLAEQPVERVVYLGSGHLQGLARETALKLLELTAGERLGFFESTMGFRHGPKSMVQQETLIFIYLAQNAYTQQYDLDLYQELIRDQKAKKVVLIGGETGDFRTDVKALDDAARIFPYLLVGQLYAFYSSLALGYTTDNPCPSGEVNRVVKGVTIYSYQ